MLESSRGWLVGKVLLGPPGAAGLERLAEHRRVWQHGIAVPPVLAFTESCASVADRPLTVFEYVPGVDAEEALPTLDPATVLEAMRATGAALASLHQVPVEGFGDAASGLGTVSPTWNTVVTSRVDALRDAYRFVDNIPAALVKAGLDLLSGLAEEVSPVAQPAVAHLDVYLPNILLDDEGGFRVLLDLEHVRWVDPVMDFVKPAMWMFPDQQISRVSAVSFLVSPGVSARWRLSARFNSSTDSSMASGGHAATAMVSRLNSGAAAMLAHKDKDTPSRMATHADHRPPSRAP